MIEKFCDIDSQVETKIKLRYQLFCEGEDQIYYSKDSISLFTDGTTSLSIILTNTLPSKVN